MAASMALPPGQIIIPQGPRSATAAPGSSDIRYENIYSALVVAHGASGQNATFAVAKGGAIPEMQVGTGTATTNAHQKTYDFNTTNFLKPAELGQNLGDAAIDDIGLTLETAYVTSSTGALNTYGAGQQELNEVLTKTFFQFQISSKPYITGAAWMFPALGGAFGSISTTGNAVTVAIATNGLPGFGKSPTVPILAERTDTITGLIGVGAGASYTFSVTSGAGQPCLLWTHLRGAILGDAR